MELLNGEIFGAVQSLTEIYEKEWPVTTSLALAKLAVKLNGPYQIIEKVRNDLIHKHGAPTENNPMNFEVKPGDENWKKFSEEQMELMMQKTELDFDKVKLPQEVNGKPATLKPRLLVSLEKFIEIEE